MLAGIMIGRERERRSDGDLSAITLNPLKWADVWRRRKGKERK